MCVFYPQHSKGRVLLFSHGPKLLELDRCFSLGSLRHSESAVFSLLSCLAYSRALLQWDFKTPLAKLFLTPCVCVHACVGTQT